MATSSIIVHHPTVFSDLFCPSMRYFIMESVELCLGGVESFVVFLSLDSKEGEEEAKRGFTSAVYISSLIFMYSQGAVCLFQQASSDVTVRKEDEEEAKRGFTSAMMLPSGQGLLCVTVDQGFLFYSPIESPEGTF
ncbi:hypothetical protein L6452_19063 [Arctium lappa]|uniref:Uncharacterized protein n=1 Tax=Arctium lappa TaxID=4217 RepID=A0ACB9B6Z1_ARCLA|nr:hypothetical protein L6452_19063 [Arctium lappa]